MSPTPVAASAPVAAKNYLITQLDAVPPVPCPCGQSRRGFATPDNKLATIHLVDISIDAQTHYHKQMTEIYLILEGEGFMELDGERIPALTYNHAFLGYRVPAGKHRLTLRYRPAGFTTGALLSLVTLAGLAAAGVRLRISSRAR